LDHGNLRLPTEARLVISYVVKQLRLGVRARLSVGELCLAEHGHLPDAVDLFRDHIVGAPARVIRKAKLRFSTLFQLQLNFILLLRQQVSPVVRRVMRAHYFVGNCSLVARRKVLV